MSLSGLAQLHVELTSRCSKPHLCNACGHQDATINPNLQYGDMDYALLQRIRTQLEPGVVVMFHRDGEPTDYPRLGDALDLFQGFTTSLTTHGLNLTRKAQSIIGRCTTLTVSVFRGDPDGEAQYETLQAFLALKGDQPPRVQVKIVGDAEDEPYRRLGLTVIRRLIHNPGGNHHYAHRAPTIPEGGICLDALHRPSIDWRGRVFLCNRLDTTDAGYLGSLHEQSLDEIWNGERRQAWLRLHQQGRRDQVNSLCAKCTYYGVPSEYQPQPEPNYGDLIQIT